MPISNISKQFGLAVRNRRKAAGLSQEQLAERAGLHPTYVGMIERGVRNSTLDVAARLARGLKLELAALIVEAQSSKGGGKNKA